VYLHQSRLNPKEGFGSGARWDWHQDYSAWQRVDGMVRPDCIMASVFIDDCSVERSPLLVIPRSHRHGFIDSIELHRDAKGYSLYELDRDTVARLADENGIEPLIGGAGTVALVDCNLIHGSANNISPWRRAILYLIYNACGNACTNGDRPWFQNHRDFTPLQPVEDTALAEG
jgi:ectoine hydroxylase